jgi:small subunit ribosomal protein S9
MVEEPREDDNQELEGAAEGGEQEAVPGEPGEATPAPEAADAEEGAAAEEPAAPEEPAAAEEPASEAAAPEEAEVSEPEEEAAPAETAAEGEPGEAAPAERPRPERRPKRQKKKGEDEDEEVIPGAHLEPDLVLEQEREAERAAAEYGAAAEAELAAAEEALSEAPETEAAEEAEEEPAPVARQPLDLAADARYRATGKRKSAVARVILRPGDGTFRINERHLDEYFPRVKLQRMARQPLEVAGYGARLDVVARIHGGGTASQAGAIRHGIARALVEADPSLRSELKRRGYLTRDPRVKERKKAGLKKARKRPQFSKR